MQQPSFLPRGEEKRVQVLVPYPLSRAYDYVLPEGITAAAGDYVRVPLGRRDTIGVVWGEGTDDKVDPAKLKQVQKKFDFTPMTEENRRFVEWVARYTMSDMGSVLKMALSAPEAFTPPKAAQAFTTAGASTQKLSQQRARVIDLLKDGVPRRAADIARET